LLCAAHPAEATVAFGQVDSFESTTVGAQPMDLRDSSDGWVGSATVVTSGTDGVMTNPSFGGSQFAKIVPGDPGSYQPGYRDAPYSVSGRSVPYPTSGDTYSFVTDLYTQSTANGGNGFWWTNAAYNNSSGDYLTETGFHITPGAADWNFTTTAGGNPSTNLAADSWYTLEVTFDRSGSNVSATHSIYAQGGLGGTPLYSVTMPTVFQNPASSDLGGPRYSWFTVWDDNSVGAIYVDNLGTVAAVPEVSSFVMGLAICSVVVGGVYLRRQRTRAAV
jgi:hypothetical protein